MPTYCRQFLISVFPRSNSDFARREREPAQARGLDGKLSLDERLECLTSAMESHLDCGRGDGHKACGFLSIQFFDIAQ